MKGMEVIQKQCIDKSTHIALLDDGLQQWRLKKTLEVVMVDALNPFGNGWLMPKGRLREYPHVAMKRADVVILHRADLISRAKRENILQELKSFSNPKKCITFAATRMKLVALPLAQDVVRQMALLKQTGRSSELTSSFPQLQDKAVYGICGIGSPEGFQRLLANFGEGSPIRVNAFPDHHTFTHQDIDDIEKDINSWNDLETQQQKATKSMNSSARIVVVVTQKDYFRSSELLESTLGLKFELRVALCEMDFIEGEHMYLKQIDSILHKT